MALEIMAGLGQVKTSKRRFFVGSENCAHCAFAFNQHRDGSIYISSPSFEEVKWHAIDEELGMVSERFSNNTKLTVHGSGVSHIKVAGGDAEFRYEGTFLKRENSRSLGVRHLLTAYVGLPNTNVSPPGSRLTDLVLRKVKPKPGVFVFFAVPALGAKVVGRDFQVPAEFQTEAPEHQWGSFRLESHLIVWYFYRTKHMDHWPAETQACALDGIHVPLIVGIDQFKSRIEIKVPRISLVDNTLTIELG